MEKIFFDTTGRIPQGKELYQKLEKISKKDNVWGKLLNAILKSGPATETEEEPEYSDVIFNLYDGKPIRNIYIKVLDVFGASVYDPDQQAESWLEKTGNKLHLKSQKWLISNQLLFKEGEPAIPFILAESERLVRNLPYIFDARIELVPLEESDSVNVVVYAQDVWSITPFGSFDFSGLSGTAGLREENFLGTGSKLEAGLVKNDNNLDWKGGIEVNNFFGKYIRGRLFKELSGNSLNYGAELERLFISPLIKWAGGINYQWYEYNNYFLTGDSLTNFFNRYYENEIWGGYSTDFQNFTGKDKLQNEYFFTIGLKNRNYVTRAEEYAQEFFFNRIFFSGSIGYAFRKYVKDNFIQGLGRTEDIPTGTIISLLGGYEKGEFSDRSYYGIRFGKSFFRSNSSYFFGGIEAGAFRFMDQWQEGTISSRILYFSPLLQLGRSKIRSFVTHRFSYVNDPYNYQQLLEINRTLGIRGFGAPNTWGNKKMVLNIETNLYPSFTYLGFRFALITFADFALLANKDQTLASADFFHGYGVGLRFRNEHLIFPAVQVQFGYYPNARQYNASPLSVFEQPNSYYRFDYFNYPKPGIIEFE